MQLILTEEEYNKLLTKAGQVESQVEVRVEEEKKKILDAIKYAISKSANYSTAEEVLRKILDLLKTY